VSGPARTVFLGSGSFAVPIVSSLAAAGGGVGVELMAVVSAPPRAQGRRARVLPSPVGEWAAKSGVRVLAPPSLRAADAVAELGRLAPALLVLADYGQIVPPELLELPRHGALNLHPSLLPRHRGAAPIAATILAGDSETGVSLMLMDAGLDTGPLIAQRRLPLGGDETAPELEQRLAIVAADLLIETLPAWLAGRIVPTAQAGEGVTLTRQLRRADGRLDGRRRVAQLERQIRAYQPWPGSFIDTGLGRLIVWRGRPLAADTPAATPGSLLTTADGGLALVAADGLLELLEVQLAGGRRMTSQELLRGRPAIASGAAPDS